MAFDRRPVPPSEASHRVNNRIRARQVRLVGADGKMIGVVAVEEALRQAQEAELDLVEIAPTAVPPVCKILDYGKFKYTEQKKKQTTRRKQLKEIRLRPGTDEHDFDTKVNHARRFLGKGFKVLVNMQFRGRQMAHKDIGHAAMMRFAGSLEDAAKIESPPTQQGYRMQMTLIPK